jgi:outer membrane receptor protein involved in Fe transport
MIWDSIGLFRLRRFLPATGVLITLLHGICSQAQTVTADDGQSLAEVVVTAQKRTQSINDVGMSITALGTEGLQALNVNDTADLAKVISGFNFTPTAVGPPVYTLRGVGFYESSLSAAPAVTVYIDEAPLAFTSMTQVGVIDVQRVEVLEGPQGTLYGENSTGGAINYVAARPTKEFAAGGSLSYGNFSTIDAKGFVSGPLSDALAARFSFRAVTGGDWQYSYTRGETLGATNQLAFRLLLDWTPVDALKVAFTFSGWRDTSDFQAYQLQGINCTTPSRCPYPADYPLAPANARAADWNPAWPMTTNNSFRQFVVRADYTISPALTLTSISGYQHLSIANSQDNSATPIADEDTATFGKIDSFNQELRLSGAAQRLHWVAGAYYSHAKVYEENYYDTQYQSSTAPIPGLPGFEYVSDVTNTRLSTYAGFANADFQVTDHLTLVSGVRYTQADRFFVGCDVDPPADGGKAAAIFNVIQQAVLGSLVKPAVSGGCFTLDKNYLPNETDVTFNQNNVSWKGGLNWKTDGGILLYADAAKGYKSGSIPTVSAATYKGFQPAPQESLLAYEAGVKAPLFNRALQLNAAAFYYDYKNKQLRGHILDPVFGLVEAMVSIPTSQVWGVEASVAAKPMRGLDLSASVTYLETMVQSYSGYNAAQQFQNYAGSAFPFSPKWESVGDARYSWGIGHEKRAFVGANLTEHSVSYASIGVDPNFQMRAYTLLGARAGIEAADDTWRVSFWGDNVTNVYYWTGVDQYWDTRFRIAAKPATYGVKFEYRY